MRLSHEDPDLTKGNAARPFIHTLTKSDDVSDDDGAVTYTSSNPGVATVDENSGRATVNRYAGGKTTITATKEATAKYEENTAQYELTVLPPTPPPPGGW